MDSKIEVGGHVWFCDPNRRRQLGWRAAIVKDRIVIRGRYQYTMAYLNGTEVQFTSPFDYWQGLSDTLCPRFAGLSDPPSDHLRYIGWRLVATPIMNPSPGHIVWRTLPPDWKEDPGDPYGPGWVVDGRIQTVVDAGPTQVKHSAYVLWDTIRECAVVLIGRAAWNGEADPNQIRQAEADPEVKAVLDSEPVFQPAWNIPASSIQYVLDQPRVGQLARVVSDKGRLNVSPLPIGTEGRITTLGGWLAVLKTSDGKIGIHDARNLKNISTNGPTLGNSGQARKTLIEAWGLHLDSRILPEFRGIAGQTGFVVTHERTLTPKDIWNVSARVQPA